MSHARTQVQAAIVTALQAITGFSTKVFPARVNPVPEDSLPVILVYSTEEEIETGTMNPPRTQLRTLTVMVDSVVQLTSGFDTELDDMQEDIEKILGGATFLATITTAKWHDITLVAATKTMSGEPGTTTAALRMEYRVQYATLENAPQTLI